MEIAEIKKSYQRKQKLYKTKQDNIRKEIQEAEEKVKELEEKESKMTYPHFIDYYIKSLAEELLKHFKNRTYDILGPFGLSSETAIHFYKKGVEKEKMFDSDNCISIDFRPIKDDGESDLVLVDHLVNKKRFEPGTIGEVNGMNYPEVPMPKTIKDLVKFIKDQNKKKQ